MKSVERLRNNVGQQPKSSARVGVFAFGAFLSIHTRVRDLSSTLACHTRAASWPGLVPVDWRKREASVP